MNQLIDDWINFCEGRTRIDKSLFHTLFWEGNTHSDLEKIFKYFPDSNKLLMIMEDYLSDKKKDISNLNIKDALVNLTLNDINQKKLISIWVES